MLLSLSILCASCLQSCTTALYATQRTTYSIENQDGEGRTSQSNFSVSYPEFTIYYTADGGCLVENRSNQMMYIDMSASHYIRNYDDAIVLYDNSIYTSSRTTAVSAAGAVSEKTSYNQVQSGSVAVSQSNTDIVQRQDERVVAIPPYTRKKIRFYELQSPSVTRISEGKNVYRKTGEVNNYKHEYANLNGHSMTYIFGSGDARTSRNTFSIRKDEILNSVPTESAPNVKVWTYQTGNKINWKQTLWAVGGLVCFTTFVTLGASGKLVINSF